MKAQNSRRLLSLDGLRGLAALVVLIHHCLLAVPELAAAYFSGYSAALSPMIWVVVLTPVHLVWGGTEAVYIFFVLSGVVLTLSARRPGFSWRAYYPSRLVRLYVPVLGAILVGYIIVLLIPRIGVAGLSDWLVLVHSAGLSVDGLLRDATLVTGSSGVITPLWSLQWEALFSIALPVYVVVVGVKVGAGPWAAGVKFGAVFSGMFLAVFLGKTSLVFLLMFAAGALFAAEVPRLRELAERIESIRNSTWVWGGLAATAAFFLSSHWTGVGLGLSSAALGFLVPVAVFGALLVVFLAAFWPGARTLLESQFLQWLGTISYSLYLVHEPIVVSIGFLVGPGNGAWVLPLALGPCLLAAYLFHRFIEKPSHRLSRRIAFRVAGAQVVSSR